MGTFEEIEKKIIFDYLCARVKISLNRSDEVKAIDKKAGCAILEMSGYKHLRKRDLDLYFIEGEKNEVIVLDEGLSLYNTDIEDVLLRKSPTIKEMLSFKNAKKILNDSKVVRSRKEDTIEKLRSSFITSLNLLGQIEKSDELIKKAVVEFDALDFKSFFKSVLVICEYLDFVYLKGLSSKLKANVFIKYHNNLSKGDIENIIIFEQTQERFLLFSDGVKAKDSSKYFKDIVLGEVKPKFEKRDALVRLREMLDLKKEYSPFNTDLFLYGVPEEILELEY